MGRAGLTGDELLDNLFNSQIAERQAKRGLDGTIEAARMDRLRKDLLAAWKAIGESGDMKKILLAEDMTLRRELQSANEMASFRIGKLKNAIEQVQRARDAVCRMDSKDEYAASVSGVVQVKNDLPVDNGRSFASSHKLRLREFQSGEIDDSSMDILDQRIRNIEIFEQLYRRRQKELLGSSWRPPTDFEPI